MSTHTFVHVEIPANDPAAAGKFYADVFGWEITHSEELSYTSFGNGGVAGGFPTVDSKMVTPGNVLTYIGTDDIEASLAKVEAAGGKTLVPKTEIPNIGHFAIFTDPTGNQMGLFSE